MWVKRKEKKKVIELIARKDKIIKESINIFYTNMYINVFKWKRWSAAQFNLLKIEEEEIQNSLTEWHKCRYIFKQLHEQANNSRTHLSIVRLTRPSSELKPRIRHLKDNIHIIRNDEWNQAKTKYFWVQFDVNKHK